MIICANCSRENADHYKFCLGCGTELAGGAPGGGKSPGVPKLGRSGGAGKLKLKGSLFAKDRPGGLGSGLGLSRRLSARKDDADEAPTESAEEAAEDAAEEASEVASAPAAPAKPARPAAIPRPAAESDAPDDADAIEIPDEPETDPEDDGFDGEIEPADVEVEDFDLQPEPPFEELDPAQLEDDDFEPEEAPVVRPATPRPATPRPATPRPVGPPATGEGPAPAEPARPAAPEPAYDEPDDLDDSLHEDAMPAGRVCQACGAIVPDGFKFCGVCGSRYDAPQAAPVEGGRAAPAVQTAGAPSAHLVLIHPDGTEGEIFPLNAGETTVGRSNPSPIFAEDPFLSPRHATFYFVQGQLYVRDEGSLNGVFLRIRAEVELFHWDMFRIGQQLLRFEEMSQVRPIMPGSGDGTTVMGSPVRGTWGRLASVVALDTTTSVWALRKPEVFLGRERGEMVFPDDGFVSGSHCKVAMRRGRYFLGDLDSTNGTYLRIKGEGIVTRGDLLLLGQQLFKVQLNR